MCVFSQYCLADKRSGKLNRMFVERGCRMEMVNPPMTVYTHTQQQQQNIQNVLYYINSKQNVECGFNRKVQ